MEIITRDHRFLLQENENLLEALERTGHEVAYQCRSGYCGACRVKILSGSVSYPSTPLAYIGQGEILPCCCRVQSDLQLDVALKEHTAERQKDLFVPDLFDEE
ncbi:MAG: class I ribonucleotide reductase maintenance protein YfaE [Neisseria sp.]|nr:class I ribonucleotide reductase maintenance protein YfaE [Neisseria sp.]